VAKLSEQTDIDKLVERLTSRYPHIPPSTVQTVVHGVYGGFDGRPLRDYIPLLVERSAKAELDQLHAAAS